MAKKQNGNGRTRNFATVVYPESAAENWQTVLSEFHVPAFISPLHNEDYNPDGEKKKEHYHVLIMYDGVKTVEQAMQIIESIGGVGCEKIGTLRGYARYLCHLDNPEKHQYNIDEVINIAGASYVDIIGLPTDKYIAIGEMIDFCADQNIYSYSDLLLYSRIHRNDWFRTLCDNGTVVMREFLQSKYWTDTKLNQI